MQTTSFQIQKRSYIFNNPLKKSKDELEKIRKKAEVNKEVFKKSDEMFVIQRSNREIFKPELFFGK